MKTIVSVIPVEDEDKRLLEQAAPGYRLLFAQPREIPVDGLRDAEVILGNVPRSVLREAIRLRWLQLNSAGADLYLQPGVLPEGVQLTNATGAYGPAVSEHLLAMTLELMKKLHLYRDNQQDKLWRDEGTVTGIADAVFLVVGLGDIGSCYARSVHALGGRVIGVRRHAGETPPYAERLVTADKLDEVLPLADVVVLCLPGTRETAALFSARRLALMKRGAFLLNGGRGTAVDTQALCDALHSGRLAGAGLDVTDPEPLPADHPLWTLPNAVITPHISGWYHMRQTQRRIVRLCAENLRRYVAGDPLLNLVDPATGYRQFRGCDRFGNED